MFYKNEDYTIKTANVEGSERYYIKHHGVCGSEETEITADVFLLYSKEFNKPIERWRNEQRRHLDGGDIENAINHGKLTAHVAGEEQHIWKYEIERALKDCTPIQQRRFMLHHVQGYSYSEIAQMEKCDYSSVRETILAVRKKILKSIS